MLYFLYMEVETVNTLIDGASSLQFSPLMLWGVLAVALVCFSVVTVILVYHWTRYGNKNVHIAIAEAVYLPVSLILIAFAIFSIVMVSNTL